LRVMLHAIILFYFYLSKVYVAFKIIIGSKFNSNPFSNSNVILKYSIYHYS